MDTTSDEVTPSPCEACSEPIVEMAVRAVCGCQLHQTCYDELKATCPCGGGDASGYMCLAIQDPDKTVWRIPTTSVIQAKGGQHRLQTDQYIINSAHVWYGTHFRLLLLAPNTFASSNSVTKFDSKTSDGFLIDSVVVPYKNLYRNRTYECQSKEAKLGHFTVCLNWEDGTDLTIFGVDWHPACEYGIATGLVDNVNCTYPAEWCKIAHGLTRDSEDVATYQKRIEYLREFSKLATPEEVQLLVDVAAHGPRNQVVFQDFVQCLNVYQQLKENQRANADDLRFLARLGDCGILSKEKLVGLINRAHVLATHKMTPFCLELVHEGKDTVDDLEKLVQAALVYHDPPRDQPALYRKVPTPSRMAGISPAARRHLLMNLWIDMNTTAKGDSHKRPREDNATLPLRKKQRRGWSWKFD